MSSHEEIGWGPSSKASPRRKFANVLMDMLVRLEAEPAGIDLNGVEDGGYIRDDPEPPYSLIGTGLSELFGRGLGYEQRGRVLLTERGRAALARFSELVTESGGNAPDAAERVLNRFPPLSARSGPVAGVGEASGATTDSSVPDMGEGSEAPPGRFTAITPPPLRRQAGSVLMPRNVALYASAEQGPSAPPTLVDDSADSATWDASDAGAHEAARIAISDSEQIPPSPPAPPAAGEDEPRSANILGVPAEAVAEGIPGDVEASSAPVPRTLAAGGPPPSPPGPATEGPDDSGNIVISPKPVEIRVTPGTPDIQLTNRPQIIGEATAPGWYERLPGNLPAIVKTAASRAKAIEHLRAAEDALRETIDLTPDFERQTMTGLVFRPIHELIDVLSNNGPDEEWLATEADEPRIQEAIWLLMTATKILAGLAAWKDAEEIVRHALQALGVF